MNKIKLIIAREYLSRVTKKTFLLATILTPIGIGLIAVVAGYFTSQAGKAEKNIAIVDQAGIIKEEHIQSKYMRYSLSDIPLDEMKKNYQEMGYDILLHIPDLEEETVSKQQIAYYSKDKLSLPTIESIESMLEVAFKDYNIDRVELDKSILAALEVNVTLENALIGSGAITDNDEIIKGDTSSKFASSIATGLSYLMGFMMYIVIFLFGGLVMRSVMEEKINRIVEVMISTVRPFELMLGKVIGVGLVGLTQLGIWLILVPIIMFGVAFFYGGDAMMTPEMAQAQQMVESMDADSQSSVQMIMAEIFSINWGLIIPVFIIFFLGGYFIYASLFAAVGSAVGDDMGESQSLMFPIIIPVLLAFVMIPSVFSDPDGPIAIFGSMFPLFSPIIMPARLPFDPPMWQIFISVVILIASIILFTWLAARIYRVGIFMYGKKIGFKEIGKWLFYKG
jgi:ABC-2 type transport system permease protein